jgi:predicted ATPase/DNA-binding winged helix-turn-helix (wHTH) protein
LPSTKTCFVSAKKVLMMHAMVEHTAETRDKVLCFSFEEFVLHEARRELTRAGVRIDIGSRALDVLLALVRRAGRVATKEEIIRDAWDGLRVAENNLTTQIARLRRALEDPEGRRFIQTVPAKGYRFVADVAARPLDPAGFANEELPHDTSSFIGRERELADLRTRMETRPLVTIVGTGGVGKTRIALRLASESAAADSVVLLELAHLTEPGLVAEALCRKLGVPLMAQRTPIDAAVSVLRGREMLLLLDNAEHLLGATAELASAVLRRCPRVRILVTSREALVVPGEATYRLGPFSVLPPDETLSAADALRSDAVRLFVERAADALGAYTLSDEDAPFVATICRRLDGIPLAMELAAARLRMLNPREIANRLEDLFRLLNVGSRSALARHQTLHATIEWSISLLSSAEQIVFRRLSVFADGCTLDGAVAVCAFGEIAPDSVFDLLTGLVGKSLVLADTSGPATRYRMLQTTHQFAADMRIGAREPEPRARMASYILSLFTRAEADWPTLGTDQWLALYGDDTGNFRAAVDWAFTAGEPALGVALVACAGALADEKSLHADLRRWVELALQHVTEATDSRTAATILYLRTALEKRLGAYTLPPERARAIELFRRAGDDVGLSRALRQTAMAMAMPGAMNPNVESMAREAVQKLQHLAPHKDLATALAHFGSVHFLAGDHDNARRLNEAALVMRRALGDRTGMLASSVNLAELLFLDGDAAGALRHAAEAEKEARRRNALAPLALILSNLAGYRLSDGDLRGAMRAAQEALRLSRASGQDYLAVMSLEHVAHAMALEGELETAASLLGFTDAHYRLAGQSRERQEQLGYERLASLLQARLPRDRLAALRAAGAGWSWQTADAVAMEGKEAFLS